MIRCLAVDDESYAADIIAGFIAKTPALELVGATSNPFEALQLVQEGKVDVVFLDVQMPELTGIQFLKICRDKCKVILTTAYPEYALDGFELDVVDYLLKPVSYERFYRAVSKLQPVTPSVNTDFIFLKGDTKNKYIKVNYHDIEYVEGLKNYISVYAAGQRIITYQTLRELETQLPQPPFYRIHKSYIVSLDHIRMIDGNVVYIGQQALPVGETYRDDFMKIIRERK